MSKFTRAHARRPDGAGAHCQTFRPRLTPLEDRTTPVAITLTGTTANVDLNLSNGGEVVTFTTNAADVITVSSSAGVVTVNGVLQSGPANLTGVRLVLVNDSIPNNGVNFGPSTATYAATFTVTLDNAPRAVNFFGNSTFAANNLTVTTTNDIQVAFADVTFTSGNMTLLANLQATPSNNIGAGIFVGGTIQSLTGTLTLSGRGGTDSEFGTNYGVSLGAGESPPATVIGGTVVITGFGGASGGSQNVGVIVTNGSLVSSNGNGPVTVTGTGGGAGTSNDNIGVLVSGGGRVTAGGTGPVVVTGTGGAGTGGSNVGVYVVDTDSQITSGGGPVSVTGGGGSGGGVDCDGVAVKDAGEITSGGGAVNVTGFGGVGSFGVNVSITNVEATSGIISSGGTAPLTITADSINFDIAVIRAGVSGTGTATLRPASAGTFIDLGGADVLAGSPLTLGLTDAELEQVTAGTLVLGRSTSGALTVTAPLTRPTATAVQLVSGANIAFTGGGVNTAGGPLALSPNTGFLPTVAGTDATASTVSFAGGSVLTLVVNGLTPDTQFTRLAVSGGVNLTGAGLALSGNYTPLVGDAITIVSAASVRGTLTGLPDGATVTLNGVPLSVLYTPTAVILRVNRVAPIVVGNAGQVRVFNPDGSTRDFEPFPGFLGDVRVASADLNRDGVPDVVVAAGQGGGPHVKVYDGATGAEIASFYAYAPTFTGGVFVAATADGRIVTGAGIGGGPHVKVIDATKLGQLQPDGRIADSALLASFYAYDPAFRGGVRVAAGDVTGDRVEDVVTGAGPGGGPHVKVFDGRTLAEVGSFFAFAPDFGGGVFVAATAGRIAVGAGAWGGPHVRVFDPAGNVQSEFFAYPADFVGGVRVAFADVDRDGIDEVITAPGLGGGLPVRAVRVSDQVAVKSFAPFSPLDPLGVFVG